MARGQFVTVALSGDYGKPRPALIIQNDLFSELPSVVVCLLTTNLHSDADQIRIAVEPNTENGILQSSQICIDKISVLPTTKIGAVIGHADDALMLRVTRAIAVFLGIGM
jgi:mRNA interferase MazF